MTTTGITLKRKHPNSDDHELHLFYGFRDPSPDYFVIGVALYKKSLDLIYQWEQVRGNKHEAFLLFQFPEIVHLLRYSNFHRSGVPALYLSEALEKSRWIFTDHHYPRPGHPDAWDAFREAVAFDASLGDEMPEFMQTPDYTISDERRELLVVQWCIARAPQLQKSFSEMLVQHGIAPLPESATRDYR